MTLSACTAERGSARALLLSLRGRHAGQDDRESVDSFAAGAKAEIAQLSDAEIAAMDRDALIDVIRASELPPASDDTWERLQFRPRDELQRLAFLARRCCRNQVASFHYWIGRPPVYETDI